MLDSFDGSSTFHQRRRWFLFLKRSSIAILIAAAGVFAAAPGLAQNEAQQEDLKKEIDALREGQAAMQRELSLDRQIEELRKGQEAIQRQLDEIKKLIEARPAAA